MKANLKITCGIVLPGLTIGRITCNNPMASKESIATFKKIHPSKVHPTGGIEKESHQTAMPAVLGQVMFGSEGQVIGILFSTPEGDYCENINGTPTGFFISGQAEEQPVIAEMSSN
jgi:hypothetical protein